MLRRGSRQSNSPRAICRHGLLLTGVGEQKKKQKNIPGNEIFRILYNNMSTTSYPSFGYFNPTTHTVCRPRRPIEKKMDLKMCVRIYTHT